MVIYSLLTTFASKRSISLSAPITILRIISDASGETNNIISNNIYSITVREYPIQAVNAHLNARRNFDNAVLIGQL
jgi:hypothetical protein